MIQDRDYLPTLVIKTGRFTSYLVDMFKEINELNQSLQMKITNILILSSKLRAFQQVSVLQSNGFKQACTGMFICLHYFICANEISTCNLIKRVTLGHNYMFLKKKIFSKFK